ncbi:type II toxin-antitoxin system Phd/YefM family antitoxin [Streptomyces sp. NPDC092296]|uniref:type II toxin-antitoxin system Phd/YefM family antitoxin n=1 Tax=Streptomyces sp. NPDC092296 TaxID=3366012 RepID=UPI0038205427
MDEMTAEEARRNFADLLNQVRYQNKTVLITRHGKPVAVIGPPPGQPREGRGQ